MTVEIACRVYELEPPVLTARPPLPPSYKRPSVTNLNFSEQIRHRGGRLGSLYASSNLYTRWSIVLSVSQFIDLSVTLPLITMKIYVF